MSGKQIQVHSWMYIACIAIFSNQLFVVVKGLPAFTLIYLFIELNQKLKIRVQALAMNRSRYADMPFSPCARCNFYM